MRRDLTAAPARTADDGNVIRAAVLERIRSAHRSAETRVTLFRALSESPDGLRVLMDMRRDALDPASADDPLLAESEKEIRAVLWSSFAPSQLMCAAVDQISPLAVLEHLMRNEAVHPIEGWADLRRRLDPHDRRCFALFHHLLPLSPVAFVEVALTADGETSIPAVLDPDRAPLPVDRARCAVLFSISSTEPGLRGIPFGRELISQTLRALREELPQIREACTLSPVPGFREWLATPAPGGPAGDFRELRRALDAGDAPRAHAGALNEATRRYLSCVRPGDRRPIDPVARFHLGNGARLEQVLIDADPTPAGYARSYGVMVTYTYERRTG